MPNDFETLKRIAQCYIQMEQLEEAEEFLKLTLETDAGEDDIITHINLLNLYWQEERWNDVIEVINTIFDIDSTQTDLLDRIALAHQQLGERDLALEAWNRTIANNDDNQDYFFNRGMLLFSMADDLAESDPEGSDELLRRASEDFQAVIRLSPDDVEGRTFLVNTLLKLEDWQGIVNVLEPHLFPEGVEETTANLTANVQMWKVLRAAYLNTGEIDSAGICTSVITTLGGE